MGDVKLGRHIEKINKGKETIFIKMKDFDHFEEASSFKFLI